MTCRFASQNQKLLPIRSKHNHKIVSFTKNLQNQIGEAVTQLKYINFGVFSQGSVLGLVLYLLYTANLPFALVTTIATYADDTDIVAAHKNYIEVFTRKPFLHLEM